MPAEISALLAQLGEDALKLLPDLLRAIRDGNPNEARRRARRAALAELARQAVERGVPRP